MLISSYATSQNETIFAFIPTDFYQGFLNTIMQTLPFLHTKFIITNTVIILNLFPQSSCKYKVNTKRINLMWFTDTAKNILISLSPFPLVLLLLPTFLLKYHIFKAHYSEIINVPVE